MRKILNKTQYGIYAAFVAVMSFLGVPTSTFANGTSPLTEGTKTGVNLIDKGTGAVGSLIVFGFWALAAWYALKFLKDKQYGQFFGFLFFVVVIYLIIFDQAALKSLADSIKQWF